MGTLYLVSTPIGNLGDVSVRALDTLRRVGLVVAEDTRRTRKLLSHYDIHCPLLSFNEHSPPERMERVLRAAQDTDVALVTDAGTPSVSDPGLQLLRAAVGAGISVSALPGPSAVLTALVLSGLPTDSFLFLGFLPRRAREREDKLCQVKPLETTIVLFEAPHRLVRTLEAVGAVLGDRPLAVCRELTKLHEEVRRSSVLAELEYWRQSDPRGEFTLVLGGMQPVDSTDLETDPLEEVSRLVAEGVKSSHAVRTVAGKLGCDRRDLYQQWLARDGGTDPDTAANI